MLTKKNCLILFYLLTFVVSATAQGGGSRPLVMGISREKVLYKVPQKKSIKKFTSQEFSFAVDFAGTAEKSES